MIVEGELQPATIKRGAKVTDIVSCSCSGICHHKAVCAIDTESRIYLSTDAKKFTAKKNLSEGVPPVGLFSTMFGVVVLRSDMTFDPIETSRSCTIVLEKTLKATKKLQKENPKLELKVVDIEAALNQAVVVLKDGTIVASRDRRRFSSASKDTACPEMESLGELEIMIPGDKLKDSRGHQVTKAIGTSLAIVLIFEDSNEFALFDLRRKRMKRVTADVKVENVSIVKGETFITSTDKRVYRVESLLDHLWGRSNEILKTEPVEDSTGAKKVRTRSKARVESSGQGKVKVYPTKSRFKGRYSGEELADPVTVSLPYNIKNLTLTNNANFSTRVNILTEEGELFAMHFRW